jgi:hypothetical protein
MNCCISVYLDCGVVFEYKVKDPMKGREHASAIIKNGYRHTSKDSNNLEWYPPHRIDKVTVSGGGESYYKDDLRAT